MMLSVGITGGIGSGKSMVCNCFKLLGIPVYNADLEGKRLMQENVDLKKSLIENFGQDVFNEDLSLNRSLLASIVFNDRDNLKLLNSIVHPIVAKDYQEWKVNQQNAPYIIREAAILYESNTWKDLDYVILVDAPEELRIRRIKNRDNRSDIEIRAIINQQWLSEKKRNLANSIIENDDHHLVLPQVMSLHCKFMNYDR